VNRKCTSPTRWQDKRPLDAKQYALGIFLDIEGAFDNTPATTVATALGDWNTHRSIKNWIISLIGRKQVCVKTEHILMTAILRGLPHGGGLYWLPFVK